MKDFNGSARSTIHTYVMVGWQGVADFVNGQYTSEDELEQMILDEIPERFCTQAEWEANYIRIPPRGGSPAGK